MPDTGSIEIFLMGEYFRFDLMLVHLPIPPHIIPHPERQAAGFAQRHGAPRGSSRGSRAGGSRKVGSGGAPRLFQRRGGIPDDSRFAGDSRVVGNSEPTN